MLRYFGASNVRIMDGGLKKWLKEGRPVHSGAYIPNLLNDGDYSYSAVDPSRVITDVTKVHKIAGLIHGGA